MPRHVRSHTTADGHPARARAVPELVMVPVLLTAAVENVMAPVVEELLLIVRLPVPVMPLKVIPPVVPLEPTVSCYSASRPR